MGAAEPALFDTVDETIQNNQYECRRLAAFHDESSQINDSGDSADYAGTSMSQCSDRLCGYRIISAMKTCFGVVLVNEEYHCNNLDAPIPNRQHAHVRLNSYVTLTHDQNHDAN